MKKFKFSDGSIITASTVDSAKNIHKAIASIDISSLSAQEKKELIKQLKDEKENKDKNYLLKYKEKAKIIKNYIKPLLDNKLFTIDTNVGIYPNNIGFNITIYIISKNKIFKNAEFKSDAEVASITFYDKSALFKYIYGEDDSRSKNREVTYKYSRFIVPSILKSWSALKPSIEKLNNMWRKFEKDEESLNKAIRNRYPY